MNTILLTLNGIFLVVSIYYIMKILIRASIIPIRRQTDEFYDDVIRGNDYPAFRQQVDFGEHTIELCMNFSTADWLTLACERACYERCCKCDYDRAKNWDDLADHLAKILHE